MKKFVLSAAFAAFGFAAPAAAAPLNTPTYNWTGYYIGANAGVSWSRVNTTPNDDLAAILFSLGAQPPAVGMGPLAISGMQFGYNWQVDPKWVLGLEADLDFSEKRSAATSGAIPAPVPTSFTNTVTEKVEWLSTVRGRLGYLRAPSLLLFATGGVAFAQVDRTGTYTTSTSGAGGSSPTHSFSCTTGVACFSDSSSKIDIGGAIGGGLEYALSRSWTLRGEYLYVRLAKSYVTETATTLLIPDRAPSSFNANFGAINIARMALNYRF